MKFQRKIDLQLRPRVDLCISSVSGFARLRTSESEPFHTAQHGQRPGSQLGGNRSLSVGLARDIEKAKRGAGGERGADLLDARDVTTLVELAFLADERG